MAYLFETEGIYLLLALLALPLIFIITFKRSSSSSSKLAPLPPGPTPWPLIGNIFHIGKMPHVDLTNYSKTYGPLISLKLGTKYMVVGSSIAVATDILRTYDRTLSRRHVPHSMPYSPSELHNISVGWAEDCNDRWKYLRNLCRLKLFSTTALESQEFLRREKVMEMVELLKENEGNVMDIGKLVFATSLNVLSNIFFSKDLVVLREEITGSSGSMERLIRGMIEVLSAPNLSEFYPVFRELDLLGLRKKGKKLWQRFWSILEPIVEEKRKRKNQTSSTPRDFMDTLVELDFSDDGILELLTELFSAGTDTTTSTVEWMMTELVRSPEAMKKVREEVDRETNHDQDQDQDQDQLIKEAHLVNLPYLHAAYKETLRLHPPGPLLIPREAPDTCQLMNYTIPKHAQIMVNIWAIGRDPEVWEEPLKFKPERFINSSMDLKGNNFELIPFGAGRRICPALPLVARHIPLIVASLIKLFDWSLPEGKTPDELNMNEKFDLTLQKEHPLLLIPRARK